MTTKGPGPLVVIGGAEDKIGRSVVLRRFIRLAGGRGNARIVVIPTASSVEPEMVAVYTDLFTRLGATEVRAVRPVSRTTADDPELAAETATATGIFMTGGNQLKLSQILTGTALGDAIHAAHSRGAVVGGTSAGASMMSSHMISLGGEGVTPRHRSSQLSAGLGLIGGVVVDQHFDQRSRYGRLMSLVATSPNLLGIGIDDARHATSDAHEARAGAPLMLSGAVVHTLPAGSRFDLERRTLVSFVEKHPDHSTQVHHSDRDEARVLAGRLRATVHRQEDS